MSTVTVIGAGLAGCEAAWALANRGINVTLIEQKPHKKSAAHTLDSFAELVCSNSLKAMRVESAAGLLKAEMRLVGSVCLEAADECAVAAGGALAVDRLLFSGGVTKRILAHPNIAVVYSEATEIDMGKPTIIATGPLTEGGMAESLRDICGEGSLSFFDAAAPIVSASSLDMTKVHAAARYGRGGDDYLNCYFDKPGYDRFIKELVDAEVAKAHVPEDMQRVYEGCMPIEKLAKRGADSPRFGPLKPVGLTDPATGHRPWAAVQLRRENAEGTLYNLVGFQTNLKFSEQKRVFSLIPGLENAEFMRYGVMHRNTFLDSPKVLLPTLNFKNAPNVYAAGQLTGFEGYMESAACGQLAALFLLRELRGEEVILPGEHTMCGALLRYIAAPNKDFQPMGANMGILPPLGYEIRDKNERYAALSACALAEMEGFANENRN